MGSRQGDHSMTPHTITVPLISTPAVDALRTGDDGRPGRRLLHPPLQGRLRELLRARRAAAGMTAQEPCFGRLYCGLVWSYVVCCVFLVWWLGVLGIYASLLDLRRRLYGAVVPQ